MKNTCLTIVILLGLLSTTRVAALALPDSVYSHPKVQQELDYLRRHPAHLQRSRERAETWLPHLLPLLRQQALPSSLAWLPAVESAYLPGAVSPVGAAGLWQLMPATAQRFGVLIDEEFDGRFAPLAASRAAIDYLAWLHRHFEGDWLLALAAYNAGEGRVRRAMERSGSRDFWQLPLPEETRKYVPRFLAVQRLMPSPGIGSAPVLREHRVEGPISLPQLAARLGVTIAQLKSWNLGLKGERLSLRREYSILVKTAGQDDGDGFIGIPPQPLFMARAAGLDLSSSAGLFGEADALFDFAPPPGWPGY
ncbi:lytic transglycosylase domain-containing protein [Zobellella iuensis]|uniref:Lytic transglycosylase domain-containing protein n=1 Tax=Zobellella iuensis TaxID=2803811 RepID=A0ABS1QVE1_9GAMM|nr:lytic transglycosylase domain-containing protein [Zobellella iuensis]MBL1378837.1 lytic transglycosylase domain-containing protein [Zobellella iuensis]